MADGSRSGISVGGYGVPLVFFHGIGMNRRVYLRLLSRLPQLGFTVIAIDAPGHGDSSAPARNSRSFAARMATTDTVLDTLGVERALLVGHSMGGRTVAEIGALRPGRALGAVLIDPALGAAFDDARHRVRSPAKTARGLIDAASDSLRDRVGLGRLGVVRYLGMIGGRAINTIVHPRLFMSTATAIVRADESALALTQLREHAIPTIVVHGERDMIVPLQSAIDAAQLSAGTLVTLPLGYHSWVLSSPWTFVQILRQVIMRGALGDELRTAVTGRSPGHAYTQHQYLRPGAQVSMLLGAPDVIGRAEPRNHRLYHEYRIGDRITTEGETQT
jgi:pimeloyl-ACP methyl ester carboxylesterase